jgi:hypothetical protein
MMHITPTTKKRKNRVGEKISCKKQGRCITLGCKMAYLCSQGRDNYNPHENSGMGGHASMPIAVTSTGMMTGTVKSISSIC